MLSNDQLLDEIVEQFGIEVSASAKVEKTSKKTIKNIRLTDQKTAWVILGWQTNGITVENLKEYATLNVINTILGSGMSSRLFVNLREAEGLAYQLGSSYSPNMLASSFIIYIGTNPSTMQHSIDKALIEIKKFKTESPYSSKQTQKFKHKEICKTYTYIPHRYSCRKSRPNAERTAYNG